MSQVFAKEYTEDYGYYYDSKSGRCENPHCGHYPIFHRYVLRSEISGDVKEIGSHCYQRWRQARGLETEPWFDEYQIMLQMEAKMKPGRRFMPSDRLKLQKDAYKKWLMKEVKRGNIKLERQDQPLQNFPTMEAADKYAREQGGYCGGGTTVRGSKFWIIYVML